MNVNGNKFIVSFWTKKKEMKKDISDRRIAVFIPFGANSDFQLFSKHNYAGKLSNGINVLKN